LHPAPEQSLFRSCHDVILYGANVPFHDRFHSRNNY
jgi:hypothetical protein